MNEFSTSKLEDIIRSLIDNHTSGLACLLSNLKCLGNKNNWNIIIRIFEFKHMKGKETVQYKFLVDFKNSIGYKTLDWSTKIYTKIVCTVMCEK